MKRRTFIKGATAVAALPLTAKAGLLSTDDSKNMTATEVKWRMDHAREKFMAVCYNEIAGTYLRPLPRALRGV